MRSRPEVEVRMPSFVEPGGSLLVDLLVRSGSVTPIDFIELELKGVQYLRVTPSSAHQSSDFLVQTARVAERGKLDVGDRRYQAAFPLPAGAFPSYTGQLFQYRYFLKLHVSIPWWPDVVERYDAQVVLPPATRGKATPFAGTNVRGTAPFVEVSLADQYFSPGDVIEGGLAFGNLGGKKPTKAVLSLLGYERFQPYTATETYRFTAAKGLEGVGEGDEVPFRFAVPKEAIPSFDLGQVASLFWAFEVQIEAGRSTPVTHATPLTLARFDRPTDGAALRRRVGNGRWHAVWAEVGRAEGLTLDPTQLELRGTHAGCAVTVDLATDEGKQGLRGELRWDPWGLGLSIRTKGLLDFGLDLDDKVFSHRLRARGRDDEQTIAALIPALRRALILFDEVYLDDQRAVLHARTPGHDQPWIGQFIRHLHVLAQAIEQAAAAIPPPPALASFQPAYARFAEELGARVEPGSLSLRGGRFDGARVTLETDFARGEVPRGTVLTVDLDPPLASPINLKDPGVVAASSPGAAGILASLERKVRELYAAHDVTLDATHALSPRVEERAIVLPIGVPLADPARAREVLGTLLALGAALRGDRPLGPYR